MQPVQCLSGLSAKLSITASNIQVVDEFWNQYDVSLLVVNKHSPSPLLSGTKSMCQGENNGLRWQTTIPESDTDNHCIEKLTIVGNFDDNLVCNVYENIYYLYQYVKCASQKLGWPQNWHRFT